MNLRIIIFLLPLLLGAAVFSSTAQNSNQDLPYDAHIHLENLPVIAAKVIADNNDYVTVIDMLGDTFRLDYDQITKIRKQSILTFPHGATISKNSSRKWRHYLGGSRLLPREAFVYLRGGTVINGTIISGEHHFLTIIDENDMKIEVDPSTIRRIQTKRKGLTYYKKQRGHYNSGYFITYLSGNNISNQNYSLIRELMLGRRHNKRLSYGAGLGLNILGLSLNNILREEFVFLSPFIYGRYNLTTGNKRFFTSAKVGYGLAPNLGIDQNLSNNYNASFNFMPSIGMTFAAKRSLRFVVEYGLNFQKVSGSYDRATWFGNGTRVTGSYESLLIRPMLKLGIEFK